MDFNDYSIDPAIYDEMFLPDGEPREHSRQLHQALADLTSEAMVSIQERVNRSFSNEGISFTVYGDEEEEERIIPVDSIPRIVSADDWRVLESGLTQRLRTLNLFIEDVYNQGQIIKDGVIPEDVVMECPQYRPEMSGFSAPHGAWAVVCGTDVVRTNDGFRVLEDNLRVPSGVSYMIANRKAVKTSLRRLYRSSRVREVEHYGSTLLATLRELAPGGKRDPSIALLTPGVYNSAFYEHIFLARELGAELVEGRDLLVDNGIVYMRTTEGLRRVDVVYRRVDDDFIDPQVFRSDSLLGAPGLLDAYKSGNVALANAPGTGVADDKSVYAYVPDMVRYYLSEEPILANVETYLCRRPQDLEYTLDNLHNLVVKRVGESGRLRHDNRASRNAPGAGGVRQSAALRARGLHIAAGPVPLPLALPHRRPFEPRHVDLRPFVLQGRENRLVPGAFCRVALRRGSLVVNSSQGGGGKDVWVLRD